jgi:anti-sigma factor RsiW
LLRYVYNELPAEEQQEIEEALLHDPELAETCAEILLTQRTLNGFARDPRPAITATILQYSRTFLR